MLSLYRDPAWILRRVETVQHLDAQRIERRTTLDIDCAQLRDRAIEAGANPAKVVTLPIPIAVLPKGLLLDIDVRDGSGQALAVSVSDRDSSAAESLMLARISELPGVHADRLNPAIPQKLYDIAAGMPHGQGEDDGDWAALTGQVQSDELTIDSWRIDPGLTVSAADVEQWRNLFDDDEFSDLVLTFSLQYLLITSIDVGASETATIKFRHVEVSELESDNSFVERLGLGAFFYLIDAPAVGRSAREHIRIVAPRGTFLQGLTLVDLSTEAVTTHRQIVPAIGNGEYQSRVTPERAVMYSKSLPNGSYSMMVSLRPEVGGFVRPALLSAGASMMLLLGGLWQEIDRRVLTGGDFNVEAAVALLLIFPSISSAYIAREGEHELLRRLLTYPRTALGFSAVATILAAAVVVVDLSHSAVVVWWSCALGVSGIVVFLLASIYFVSKRSERIVREKYHQTLAHRPVRF